MKRNFILLILMIAIMSLMLFSGCASKVLYGTWQVKETIDLKTGEGQAPMFANIMVFTINKDGTVYFADKEFGTFTKDRLEFHFVETSDKETKMDITGAYELDGGNLYIMPDDAEVKYHLVSVEQKDDKKDE